MKRNMDLVREILLAIEAGHRSGSQLSVKGYTDEQVFYHLRLMHEAGLVEALVSQEIGVAIPYTVPIRLTWPGHEFLDNARSPAVWKAAKEVVAQTGSTSLDVLKSVLVAVATAAAQKYLP